MALTEFRFNIKNSITFIIIFNIENSITYQIFNIIKSFKLHWITLDLRIREMYDLYVKDKNMKMTP